MTVHRSVMLSEVLAWLSPRPGEVMVDGTLGGGGHAAAICAAVAPAGRLIGLDRDPAALERARAVLAPCAERCTLLAANFADLATRLAELGIGPVDGLLLDLGLSSDQLTAPERGFSFSADGPLDMRMDPEAGPTAADLVNRWPQDRLAAALFELGEEARARAIARALCERRRRASFRTTLDLAGVVASVLGRHGRIHPATRTFQALRIAVNGELEALERVLADVRAGRILRPGGRAVVLSFHSLEDRRVKTAFREGERAGELRVLTKKPLQPTRAEELANPRARSAKLRAAVFVGGPAPRDG